MTTLATVTAETTSAVMSATVARVLGVWRPRGTTGVYVPVVVLDRRTVFGKPQLLVTPIEGWGETWTSADAVTVATVDDITDVTVDAR